MQLEIEQTALKKEKDPGSQERLKKLEKELADLKEQSSQLKAQWQNEKAAINAVSIINSQLDVVSASVGVTSTLIAKVPLLVAIADALLAPFTTIEVGSTIWLLNVISFSAITDVATVETAFTVTFPLRIAVSKPAVLSEAVSASMPNKLHVTVLTASAGVTSTLIANVPLLVVIVVASPAPLTTIAVGSII
jgi:hypothetical protein